MLDRLYETTSHYERFVVDEARCLTEDVVEIARRVLVEVSGEVGGRLGREKGRRERDELQVLP